MLMTAYAMWTWIYQLGNAGLRWVKIVNPNRSNVESELLIQKPG